MLSWIIIFLQQTLPHCIMPVSSFIVWCWYLCCTCSSRSEADQQVAWAGDMFDQITALGFSLRVADNEIKADSHRQSWIYFSGYIPHLNHYSHWHVAADDSNCILLSPAATFTDLRHNTVHNLQVSLPSRSATYRGHRKRNISFRRWALSFEGAQGKDGNLIMRTDWGTLLQQPQALACINGCCDSKCRSTALRIQEQPSWSLR